MDFWVRRPFKKSFRPAKPTLEDRLLSCGFARPAVIGEGKEPEGTIYVESPGLGSEIRESGVSDLSVRDGRAAEG